MKDLAITLRPRKLSEIFNQNSIVNELQTRATSKKWPTAMLFKGPSGTGKSTAAQIVAMTINCTHLDSEGNPCGKCASCKSIINEKFDRDTLVLDGSTIGVKDDVISFGNLADMSPMMDKNRVLIIEESDQLSTAAKNALHKILEKPRDHVHFILLSMYNSGLPISIQSRCQTFNFKSFGLKDVALGLHTIMKNLNLWTDETIPDNFKTEGLLTLASASKGSFREAIQYLEKYNGYDGIEVFS
ncbi:MAG TPA: AAA family ATPase, partial [Bacteroidales bacterium]|nr:AAA family ATPase [Bacteroidales bacterium]